MVSVSICDVFRQARSSVFDAEDSAWGDVDALMADTIVGLFEAMGESEVEQRVGVKLYERSPERKHRRNGWRERQVQTSFRTLTIRLPRLRDCGFVPSFLEPNHRAIATTEQYVQKAFLCGISRAEIERLMESATGCRPSEGLIRRVQSKLDENAEDFRKRKLTKRYTYLFLDAAWVKNIIGVYARRVCILTAVGVSEDGRREVLGFERASKECTASWGRFLEHLLDRGLNLESIRLVISDEHEGLKKAVAERLGDVPHQLCWAHRCRNLFEAVEKADRKAFSERLRTIYRSEHLSGARDAFRQFKFDWKSKYPLLVATTEEDLGYLLAFYDVPELHREYVRTSNPIERLFVELSRSRFASGAFVNRQACDRVVGGVFIRINEIWSSVDIWEERRRKRARKEQAFKASQGTGSQKEAAPMVQTTESRSSHHTDPASGARGAPQQSPILPDG